MPLGTLVTFNEELGQYPFVQSVDTTVSPANLNAGSGGVAASLYVGNQPPPNNVGNLGADSVTQATFTNEAFGNIEICKSSKSIETGEPFGFTVAGVAGVQTVDVGYCSTAIPLPVGTTTVSEIPQTDIFLNSVTSSITGGVTRSGNTATVTVPYAADNSVTFDNEINSGTFKICMNQSSPDADLENTQFPVSYSYTLNNTTYSSPTTLLYPGQCTLTESVQIRNQDLSLVPISVTEGTTPVADVELSGFSVVPASGLYGPIALPHLLSSPGGGTAATGQITLSGVTGTTTVTFTNARTAT
jgi:hypothetical protein